VLHIADSLEPTKGAVKALGINLPAEHGIQDDSAVLPVVPDKAYLPITHRIQQLEEDWTWLALQVPAAQSVHTVFPVEAAIAVYFPAAQEEQADEDVCATPELNVPNGQLWQTRLPTPVVVV